VSAFIHINGLDFDIFIRGLLVVGTGVAILMGSVYILLATNSGARTGLLLAATGFFGWMVIMGIIWWIYGIGLKGDAATWKVIEMNRGDLSTAQLDQAARLGQDLAPLEASSSSAAAALTDMFKKAEDTQSPPELAGWDGMLASNRARGEAQAAVDAFLTNSKEFEAGTYVPVAAFEIGGKDLRPAKVCKPRIIHSHWSGCPDRIGYRLKTIFVQPFHPPHYAALMVQAATPASLNVRPGEAPPIKQVDEAQPLYTIIMERDLGSKRLPPAMITLGSIIIFTVLVWRLHDRDKREMEARAAYEASVGKR
jgi:hypothetical protein